MNWKSFSLCVAVAGFLRPDPVWARSVGIPTPNGVIYIDLTHAGPTGQLVEPDPPQDAGFRPPTIFAAPLPTGSGSRALGQAGAFTAVADDATAASWNPAGLTQLERSEMSAVYRFSTREDQHHSTQRDLLTDRDRYSNQELNYVSAVYPFLLNDFNAVFSLNYQEAYDFTHRFSARFSGGSQQTVLSSLEQTFYEMTTNRDDTVNQDITILKNIVTVADSQVDQLLRSSLLSDIEFVQAGTIDAISPAFAVELTPRLSLGVAVNIYTDGASRGNSIRSALAAEYSGTSESYAEVEDVRSSVDEISWSGVTYGGPPGRPREDPISGEAGPYHYADTNLYVNEDLYRIEGVYQEKNRTEQFFGVNATLGALWTATDRLMLGVAVDLPWTGHATQTKQVAHQITAVDSNGVAAVHSYSETNRRDVEYTLPLYWSLGALWRWNDRLYSSMDVSRTHWSGFSYKADGEQRINPLNGETVADDGIDDCWSLRFGSEYLWVLSWTEIPVRGGLFWEQRPAIGTPDQYWGATLGSGISLGSEPGKMILDIAYSFERGEKVMGSLLPGQGMASDTTRHQLFVSAIWHF